MKITIPPWTTGIYFRPRLQPDEIQLYMQLLEGFRQWKERIPLEESWDEDRVYRVYERVLRDHPMLFHVPVEMRYLLGKHMTVTPKYTLSREEYRTLREQVVAAVMEMKPMLEGKSAGQRLRILHDRLVRGMEYGDIQEENCHNVLGALVERRAVCEGISKAFKLLCDGTGIHCICVAGCEGDGPAQAEPDHMWNLVKLDGAWYQVDVTFDLALSAHWSDMVCYDYFCRSDAVFFRDHQPTDTDLPSCPRDGSIYRTGGWFADSGPALDRLIRKMTEAGRGAMAFAYAPHLEKAEMAQMIGEAFARNRLGTGRFEINEKCAVARLSVQ